LLIGGIEPHVSSDLSAARGEAAPPAGLRLEHVSAERCDQVGR
jgi:hypothetical protein